MPTSAPPEPVRLVMTLLVSDEDDLVEPNLRYHFAQGVDFAVVTANRAPDHVLAAVQQFVDEGRARLLLEPGDDHDHQRWLTRMARLAARDHGADWVLNADADEFYWPEAGPDLRTIFAAVPERWGVVELPVCHFLAPPEPGGFFADAITVREVRSLKPRGSSHLVKVAHRGRPEIEVSRGGHRIAQVDLEQVPAWRPIIGLHFPMRSYEQFERKVIKSGRAQATRDPHNLEARNLVRLRAWEAGRLRDHYDPLVATPEVVANGVAEGRLVVDERLKHFFAAGAPGPAPIDPAAVEAVRVDLMRALHEWEYSPLRRDVERERGRVRRLERRLRYLEELPELRPRRLVWRLRERRGR
jgi:Glycosyl transferase family 2